jgi:hypothetical protein
MKKSVSNPFNTGVKWATILDDEHMLSEFTELYNTAVDEGHGQLAYVYLYIKNEIHKPEKIADKRFRLIFGVSGLDQMVDRVLFKDLGDIISDIIPFQRLHVVKYKGTTFAVRFKFGNKERFENEDRLVIEKDMAADYPIIYVGGDDVTIINGPSNEGHWFDYSMNDWLKQKLQEDMEIRIFETMYGFLPERIAERLRVFNNPSYQTPGGSIGTISGVFESGNLLTYWMNTIQSLFKSLPWIYEFMVESETAERVTEIATKMGYKLTKIGHAKLTDHVSFCGFNYTRISGGKVRCTPEYQAKHSAALAHLEERKRSAISTMASYARMYSEDHKKYKKLRTWALKQLRIDIGPRMNYVRAALENKRNDSHFPARVEVGGGTNEHNNNNGETSDKEGTRSDPARSPEGRE